MEEQIEEVKVKRYQWVRSDKTGIVETFKEEREDAGSVWIYFESGSRIKTELISEFLLEVTDEQLANDPIHGIDSSEDVLNSLNPQQALEQAIPQLMEAIPMAQKSPVRQLLEKQAKKNVEEIQLVIEMPIPKKSIYEVIRDSYEDGEVDEELSSMLLENLGSETIKDQLKKAVINLIENYYNIKIQQDGKED